MPVELVVSEVAMGHNHSALCDSPPDTVLQDTGEISPEICVDISDIEEKCKALVNAGVTLGDNANIGKPEGQVEMVADNPDKCGEICYDMPGTTEVDGGPLQVQEGNNPKINKVSIKGIESQIKEPLLLNYLKGGPQGKWAGDPFSSTPVKSHGGVFVVPKSV